MRGLASAVACGLVGAMLITVGMSSRALAQEDQEPSLDQKIRNNILGAIGLKGGPDIDYKERSPLVLPPKIDLPPPQPNAAAATPNWPVDADQKRRREEANHRRDEVEESRPLRPSELNVGQRRRSSTPGPSQDEADGRPSRPSELGYKGGILNSLFGSKEQPAKFTSEPPRTSLIEPPVGYQTPSPEQPYMAKPERWMPKIPSFFDFGSDQR